MQLRYRCARFVVYLKCAHAQHQWQPVRLIVYWLHISFTHRLQPRCVSRRAVAFSFALNTMQNFLIPSFACIYVLRLAVDAKFSAFLYRASRLLRCCSTLISGARHKQLLFTLPDLAKYKFASNVQKGAKEVKCQIK